MRRIIAKAIRNDNPYASALASLQNCFWAVADFMYGTPERTRVTLLFAFALAMLGGALFSSEAPGLLACPA